MGVPGKTEGTIFSPIPCEVTLTGPERVGGKEAVIRKKKDFTIMPFILARVLFSYFGRHCETISV